MFFGQTIDMTVFLEMIQNEGATLMSTRYYDNDKVRVETYLGRDKKNSTQILASDEEITCRAATHIVIILGMADLIERTKIKRDFISAPVDGVQPTE